MKQLFHVVLGLFAVIFMSLSYLLSKLFGIFSSKEPKRDKPWLEDFIILYINKCLIFDGDITDLSRLSRGELDFGQQQSLLGYLKAYLHKIGERYEPSDYKEVLDAIPKVWRIHTTGFRSESAVRNWCRDQNPDGSDEDVDAFVSTVRQADKTSEDWLDLSKSLLKFRFERLFYKRHSEDFLSYTETILEDYMSSAGVSH